MSVFAGQNISIEKGNQNTLAVGNGLKIEGPNMGTAVLGRNVYTNAMGLHYGGGDRVSAKEGNQQGGLMIFANATTFTAAGNVLEMVLGNDTITRLEIQDETAIVCSYILHASDAVGLFIYETGSFYLDKTGGVTLASTPVVLSADDSGTALTLAFSIDTATNTAQHRFKVTSGGAGFPHAAVRVVLSVNYNQIR